MGSISWSITRVASNSVSRLRNLQLMPLMQHSRLMSTRYSGLLKRQFTIYLQGRNYKHLIGSSLRAQRDPAGLCSDQSGDCSFYKIAGKTTGTERDPGKCCCPGPYWTVLQCCGGQPQEKIEQFGASSPLGRPGQPAEIAPLYVTLASPENSYTSGQVWCSDGGTGTL